MTITVLWLSLSLVVPLAFIALALIVVVVRAGPTKYVEAARLQGTLTDIYRGHVSKTAFVDNNPQVVEGMARDRNTGRYEKNNRLSDDYLKSVFGS